MHTDSAFLDDPAAARPRHRHRGLPRCPFCPACEDCLDTLGTDCGAHALAATPNGALECSACKATLAPPRPPESPWMSDPCTQDEHGPWHRFSWNGNLQERWGTSTDRENGAPPAKLDEPEEPTKVPRIRVEHRRGREDQLLDGVIASFTAGTAALADTLRELLLQARKAKRAPPAPSKPVRRRSPRDELAAVLLDHLDATTRSAPAETDPLRQRLAGLPPALHDGLARGAILLAVDALLRRGVDVWAACGMDPGPLEPLAFKLPRTERFSGTLHAVAIAYSQPELAPRPSGPSAPAVHPLKGGMRFGEVTCHPSHGGSGRAPGEDQLIDKLDVEKALTALSPRDRDLLVSTGTDPGTKKQRSLAWQRAADALRGKAGPGEQSLIPPRKPRKLPPPDGAHGDEAPVHVARAPKVAPLEIRT